MSANLWRRVAFENYLSNRVCFKTIHGGVTFGRGCRHWHWREAWTASGNGGIGGAAIAICGTGEKGVAIAICGTGEKCMPPFLLAGHAYVASPAIGAGGKGYGTVFWCNWCSLMGLKHGTNRDEWSLHLGSHAISEKKIWC